MAISPISQELRQFLRKNISSIRQLELLVWLHENPSVDWNAKAIAKILFCQPASVSRWLNEFEKQRLTDPKNKKLIAELITEYKTRPARIIRFVADEKKN